MFKKNRRIGYKGRIRVVILLFFLVAILILRKLFIFQVIDKDIYINEVNSQHISSSGDIFTRGSIFFSKKDGSLVSAATVTSGYKVSIKPDDLEEEPDILYEKLEPYLEIDYDTFVFRANKKGDPYEEIANKLTKEEADEISGLKIKGLSVHKENWRSYPSGDVAAHSIGFLAYKENELKGRYGLESFYESVLARPQDQPHVNFFAETFSDLKKGNTEKKKGDIVTTLEPVVSYTFETELLSVMNKWNADEAGGIIIDPQSGEIYALAAFPDFDLNDFRNVSDPEVYRNPLVENVLEFGSIIKPIVMASALDVGVISPETTYYDEGYVVVEKKIINNFDKKGRGHIDMQEVLNQSLNTGMVFVQSKLGNKNLKEYIKLFGLGEKTNIDLPNETPGLVKNLLDSPRDIEHANASFGQGIAFSPVGVVRSLSILANGGNLIVPHLMKEIRYNGGSNQKNNPSHVAENIIKEETAETITKMLVKVFDSYDNGSYKFDHYTVAAKTGTAQIANEKQGGYYEDRHTHSFFAYFPAYDPKFLVFIYLKNPKNVKYASQTLIPPFVNIAKFLLGYYNVSPDR